MSKSFLMMRFQFVPMMAGLFMLLVASYGLATFVPIPDSSPFSAPPYDLFFCIGIALGLAVIVFAYVKTPKF